MDRNLLPLTEEFIARVAINFNINYTLGKKGEEIFCTDNGDPIYLLNGGFVGTRLEIRTLPRCTREDSTYHKYEVIKSIDGVLMGETAPWFNQPDGGIQYKLPNCIKNIKDCLKEVQR